MSAYSSNNNIFPDIIRDNVCIICRGCNNGDARFSRVRVEDKGRKLSAGVYKVRYIPSADAPPVQVTAERLIVDNHRSFNAPS